MSVAPRSPAASAVRGRRLLPNFVVLLSAHVLSKSTTLVSLFLLGRYLGDAAFGRYAVALAIPVALESLGDLGMSQMLIRDGAGRPEVVRRDAFALFAAKLLLASLMVVASYVAAAVLQLPGEIVEMVLYLALAKALDSFTILSRSIFEAFERMDYEAASLILDSLVRLLLVVYALLSGFALVGIAKAITVSSAIVMVSTIAVTLHRFLRGIVWSVSPGRSVALLLAGLPLATVWLFEGLSFRIDIVVVERLMGDSAAGAFGAAARVVEPLLIVPLVMGMTTFPVISRHLFERRDTLSRLFRAGLQLSLLAALLEVVALVGLGQELVVAAFGPDFVAAGGVVRLLALALLPLVVRVMLVNVLTVLNLQRRLLVAQVVGTASNLVVALLLVPPLGVAGAVVAVILGETVIVALGWSIVRRFVEVELPDVMKTVGLGLLALMVVVASSGLGPLPSTLLGVATVLFLARLLTVVHEDEARYLRDEVPRLAWLTRLLLGPTSPR